MRKFLHRYHSKFQIKHYKSSSRYGREDKGIFHEEKLPGLNSGVIDQKVKDVPIWRRQKGTINFYNKNINETFLKHTQAT